MTAQLLHDEATKSAHGLFGASAPPTACLFEPCLGRYTASRTLRRVDQRFYNEVLWDDSSDEEEVGGEQPPAAAGAGACEDTSAGTPVWATTRCIWCLRSVDHNGERCSAKPLRGCRRSRRQR